LGSARELEYHLLLASELGFLSQADDSPLRDAVIEVKRVLANSRPHGGRRVLL
jgi:hypothetical protein